MKTTPGKSGGAKSLSRCPWSCFRTPRGAGCLLMPSLRGEVLDAQRVGAREKAGRIIKCDWLVKGAEKWNDVQFCGVLFLSWNVS